MAPSGLYARLCHAFLVSSILHLSRLTVWSDCYRLIMSCIQFTVEKSSDDSGQQTEVSDKWTSPDVQLDNSWTIRDNELKTSVVKATAV